jgi:hypothetical protein
MNRTKIKFKVRHSAEDIVKYDWPAWGNPKALWSECPVGLDLP